MQTSPLASFEGDWHMQIAILDFMEDEGWSQTEMMISVVNDSVLSIRSENQPPERINIWPEKSSLTLSKESGGFVFRREDGIDVSLSLHNKLKIFMHPPREWSYQEECIPPDVSGFQCEDEGRWDFELVKLADQ